MYDPYYICKRKEQDQDQDQAMTTITTLTSKGQTTIPKDIREGLGMKAGDQMTFTLLPDGSVVMRVKNRSVKQLYGALKPKKRVASGKMNPWR